MNYSEVREKLELFIKELALAGYGVITEVSLHYDDKGVNDRLIVKFYRGIYPEVRVVVIDKTYEIFPHHPHKPIFYSSFEDMAEALNERLKDG
jgi:hypothetical protein